MSKKKRKCKITSFTDFKLPPCTEYLGGHNPLIYGDKILYRNLNRLYFFLSYNYSKLNNVNYNSLNPSTFNITSNANLQIDLYCFLIGVYINEIEKGNLEFNDTVKIHDDKNADKFIKEILTGKYNLTTTFIPSLTYVISNSNAIIPFLTTTIDISMTNFYIIVILSRLTNNYGLLLSDNSYVTNDFINETLANIYIEFNKSTYE